MSIPPFIEPPSGVRAVPHATERATFAALDNVEALTEAAIGSAVLVPGFTGSKEDFIATLAPLAARRVRAVSFDLTGQFETPGPPDIDQYSLASFAADVWAVASTLPRPLVLVGHSFGGLVVREAILADPLAADGLALLASGPGAIPAEQQEVLRRFVGVMDAFGLEAVWRGKRALDAAAGAPLPPPEIDQFLTRRFLSNAPASLQAMVELLCGVADEVDALATVAPPTAVVVGVEDDAWPPNEQRQMAKRLDATLVELPGVGHSPAVDAPDAVADAVAQLLRRSDSVAS
ncbi:MAG: alpha/beta hydrolase [Actinomycetes bacterium]